MGKSFLIIFLVCNSNCLECSVTATNCTSCDSSLFKTLSGTICICMNGYYNVSGVCSGNILIINLTQNKHALNYVLLALQLQLVVQRV